MFFFSILLSFLLFLFFKNREWTQGKRQKLFGKERRKTKSRSTGIVSPDTSALFLLYSIFDRNIELKPVGWEHNCTSAIEIRPLVPPKTAHSFSGFFSDLLSFLKYSFVFSAFFSALFPALDQPHYLRLSQPKNRNKNRLSFVWIGSGLEFSL